jgi:hypothetical protein
MLHHGGNALGLRQIAPHKHDAGVGRRGAEADLHVVPAPIAKTLDLDTAGEGALGTKLLSQGRTIMQVVGDM